MKRYIRTNTSRDGAYRMMDRRNDFFRMEQDPVYQEIQGMLEEEKDEWQESHPNMAKWSDELSPEDKFKPSQELRKFARENGYVLKSSAAKGIYWRDMVSVERNKKA